MHVYLSLKLTIKGIVQQFSPLQKYDQDFFFKSHRQSPTCQSLKTFIFWFDSSDKFILKKILLLYIKNNFVYCKTHINIYA